MEVVTILIGVAAFIISALIIYCISAFSMREKTFEEVIEEQRRREELEREKLKAEKKAERELQKRKYKKGKHDKVKEKAVKTEPEVKAEPKMVNLEIEPEIIEPTETLGLNTSLRQRGKKEKNSKPILQNKDEHTPVVEKAAELHHKPVVPKDELELKKSHEKATVEKIDKVKVVHKDAHHEKATVEKIDKVKVVHKDAHHEKANVEKVDKVKVVHKDTHHEKVRTVHSETHHEKATVEILKVGHSDTHEKAVVEKFDKVKVVHAEAQQKETKGKHSVEIKDTLPPKKIERDDDRKPKQHDDADKPSTKSKAPADDVHLNGSRLISLVKNAKLTDSEVQSLVDILLNKQGLSAAGAASSESWNKKSQKGDPVTLLKKQLEEKEKALKEEQAVTVASNNRYKELKNELLSEKNKYTALEKKSQEQRDKLQAEMEAILKRMQSTHDQHLHEMSNLQTKIRTLEQGNDRDVVQKLTEENKIIKDTLSQKVTENKRLDDKLKQTEKELSNSRSTIQASENVRKDLETKINLYEDQIRKLEVAQKEVDSVTHRQVEEVNQELRKAEAKNASLQTDLQKATSGLNAAEVEVRTLKARLEDLEAHLTKADKEMETKLHESEYRRSDLENNVRNLENQLAGLSAKLSDYETEITRLQQENRQLSEENKTTTERLQAAPASNGNSNENGPSLSLAEHERIVSGKDKEVSELAAGLETQKVILSGLQSQLDSKTAEVSDLQEQLSQQKKKNNELTSSGVTEIETYDKTVFQRLFPDIQISDSLPHKEWVTAFEKQALQKVTQKTESPQTSAAAEENAKLKIEIEVLQNNLNIAAGKENRLKELEDESKHIHQQLNEYEKQFVELNSQIEKLRQVEAENYQLRSSQSASSVDTEAYTQLQHDNSRLESELESYRSIVTETENKVRQLEKSIDDEERKWQEKLKQAQSQLEKDAGVLKKTSELESLVSQQETQIQEYRRVLSQTEDKLRTLEGKVEREEKAWQEKYHTTQSELAKTKSTLTNLKQEFQISQGSQDMETRVQELEEELREAREKIIVITREKETVISQITETQKQVSSVDTESLAKQIVELQTQLEGERKKNKDLSLNVVKLNGIIKTGQAALNQEQTLVKKLQESLDSKSVNSGATEQEEVDQAASTSDSGTSV